MPPVLSLGRELNGVERHDDGFTAVALPHNLYAIRRVFTGGEVYCEPASDAPPAGFFAMPLNAAAGPWQLFTVVEAAAGTDDPVG